MTPDPDADPVAYGGGNGRSHGGREMPMRTRSRSLTLEEIGKRAGVSRSTVSRVLNDHPDVRPEVRARVEEVIRETGYQPNQAARALVSSRTGLIGLVMLTEVDELFGDPYYSALVNGIQQGCLEHGLIFTIFPVHGFDEGGDQLVRQIAQGFVDGVIATAGPGRDELIEALRDRQQHLVVVGHPRDLDGLTRVDVENRAGSASAVAHLIDRGYERVGYVGPTEEYIYGIERLDGYRDALDAAGRTFDERWLRLDHPTADGGYRATLALLDERPDAIHVATDTMAQGAFRAVAERGLVIPDDIAIVGFDGFPRGIEFTPTLTTVVQPVVEVGRTAVRLLVDESASDEPETVLLPTTLLVGDTSPPARQR
jgi:LacI family transcriptional regulator